MNRRQVGFGWALGSSASNQELVVFEVDDPSAWERCWPMERKLEQVTKDCVAATPSGYDFDEVLDRSKLSTLKWEMEIQQRGDADVLCFGTADMDFRAPPPVLEALTRVTEAGHLGYPLKSKSYFKAITDYWERHFDWSVHPSWIASHVGIYASMEPIIEELTKAGDEIIFFSPVHKVFPEVIEANQRCPVAVRLSNEGGHYRIDFAALRRAISAKTRMLLLCSPHNPVGRVWTKEELTELSAICLEKGIIVVSDEVYSGLLYPGITFVPYAKVSRDASAQSITLVSASKSFNLTGLKHSHVITENAGFMAAYMRGLKRSNLHYGGSIYGHAAAEAAFRDCDAWSTALMRYIAGNFDFLKSYLHQHMPDVKVAQPEATYVAWLDFSATGLTEDGLRSLFDREARIVVTFGEPMGPGGELHARFNLGAPRSVIEKGLKRLATAYKDHVLVEGNA